MSGVVDQEGMGGTRKNAVQGDISQGLPPAPAVRVRSMVGMVKGESCGRLSSPEPAAHRKYVLVHLLLILLFPWRSDGSASAHATVHVLLFLLCWFQDLSRRYARQRLINRLRCRRPKGIASDRAPWGLVHVTLRRQRGLEGGIPGTNTTNSRPHSSSRPRYRILHSSSVH